MGSELQGSIQFSGVLLRRVYQAPAAVGNETSNDIQVEMSRSYPFDERKQACDIRAQIGRFVRHDKTRLHSSGMISRKEI